jgi:polar amino acid transport system substrate-binding protein
MKRFLYSALAIMMTLGLVLPGCGGSPAPATSAVLTKVKIASDATFPPFEIVDETTKQIVGFDIDMFNAIAQNQGLQPEYINVAFDPLLAGMAQGQYDVGLSTITITDDRKKDMLFSDPYFAAGQVITVKSNNTTITGKDTLKGKVGAQIGTTGAIESAKITGVTLKTYDDIGLAFQDLMNGQIDAVVVDNPIALDYIGKNPDKLKTAGAVFTDENYGIAVNKTNPTLLAKINAGLKAIKADGTLAKIIVKWKLGSGK